ncbi:AraC family transcriptional regulator [Dyadobacter pollutisoli]|uniref:Helix-turn-helix transcriptional regulator n=1 Tax=Dyadobacter pollutisoli TaxID=2910158 RepID=A0A9E8N6X1_9BACT|nr:helix-turn-helix transcriptional regulator [Dyadobacter pollutisoli]WAC10945.1 helix-turn-helix transcriptional regulator [Dyadobacter pollutisoli]
MPYVSGYEYRVGHVHDMPDQCTIFSLSADSLEHLGSQNHGFSWFFKNPDLQSILIKATPETEYLHHHIFRMMGQPRFHRLLAEKLITGLFLKILSSSQNDTSRFQLSYKQKRNYLPVIEPVMAFINESFAENLSLSQLADIGNMSPYHFNRVFKQITNASPYNYLLRVRLQQANLQIANTDLPITPIAFSCGFNSLENFSTAYKNQFGQAPRTGRSLKQQFSSNE